MNQYRVVLIDNPDISPFPSHVWPTRELAEAFCHSEEAGEWKDKLRVKGGSDDGWTDVIYVATLGILVLAGL